MVGWSRDRFNEISARLGAFLRQAGYKEQDVFYVPVSGLSGENLTISSEPKLTEWYSGPTLLQAIGTQYFHTFQSLAAVYVLTIATLVCRQISTTGTCSKSTCSLRDQ
jgi:translation elongation factor EF-1alpha